MSILKLQNAGDSAVLEVSQCSVVEGNFGEQIMFTGTNGDTLYLPRTSADRQLSRLGFDQGGITDGDVQYDAVEGQVLEFSRAASPKQGAKPFWNINVAKRADTPKPNGVAKPTPAPPNDDKSFADSLVANGAAEEAAELAAKLEGDAIPAVWTKHGQAFFHVLNEYVPAAKKAGVEIDVSALTFQLFKSGLDQR